MTSATKETVNLSKLTGSRIGVDGTWLLTWLRSQLKRDDPYWCLAGPVSPAIEINIDKFIAHFKKVDVKLIFVFDGLYTFVQGHAPYAPHRLSEQSGPLQSYCREYVQLDEDITPFIVRMLQRKGMEVITAPYLAWAQLVYLTHGTEENGPHISEMIACIDALCFGSVRRVITECCDQSGELSATLGALAVPNTPNYADALFDRYIWNQRDKSNHWCWVDTQGATKEDVKNVIKHCPVFTQEGTLVQLSKALGNVAITGLNVLFYSNLHCEAPLTYYLMHCNVLSPSLLSVVATETFVDDVPLMRSKQYEITLERIIPLRTQIVFQFVQDLQRQVRWLAELHQLRWVKWMPDLPQPMMLPIHRPPKIALDEWADVSEAKFDFVSVLELAQNAKQYANVETFQEPLYNSEDKATAAVLLKALDLLGYFTHAAHAMSEHEVSSKSIFADALSIAGEFADEAVLLIELTRTQSLHDAELGAELKSRPVAAPAMGVKFLTRLMSLLTLTSNPISDASAVDLYFSADLSAFNEIARAFQRNLRYLTEVITCTQVLRGSAQFPLEKMHSHALRLPFGKPLSTHAGRVIEFMLSPEYRSLPLDRRLRAICERFKYLPNIVNDLSRMRLFFGMAMGVLHQLMQDEEAEESHKNSVQGYCRYASTLMDAAFQGLGV